MDTVIPARSSRPLWRRFAPVVGLSLVVFGGGSAGVYWWTHSGSLQTTEDSQAVVKAHSASTASEELKQLFSQSSSDSVSPSDEVKSPSARDLFGDSAASGASSANEPSNQSAEVINSDMPANASVPQGLSVLGDRYASLTPAWHSDDEAPSEEHDAEVALPEDNSAPADLSVSQASVEDNANLAGTGQQSAALMSALATPLAAGMTNSSSDEGSVTRGQDVAINPLRRSVETVSHDEDVIEEDARAAFENFQQSQPVPPATSREASPNDAPSGAGDPLATALRSAQPLPQNQSQDQSEPNRYSGGNERYHSAPASRQDMGAAEYVPEDARSQLPSASTAPDYEYSGQTNRVPTPADSQFSAMPLPQQPMREDSQAPANQRDFSDSGITPTPGLSGSVGTGRPGERVLEGPQSPSVVLQKLVPDEVQVGKRCTFAIRVQNTGQGTAHQVQIHDEVPLGTELVGTSPRAKVNGSKVVWDLGTLSAGEERIVEMELMPREEGELGSVATVSLAAQASAKTVCTRPDLALRLTSAPKVHAGQKHPVTIEVSNPGSGIATNVLLLETLPEGVSHEAGPALEFAVGSLQPGETRSLELILTADEAGRINNVMTARADAGLIVEASCEFEVIAPELQLTVEGPQKRFLERPATYHVSIDNPGTAPAKDVQLVTHLPQGMQYVSANNMGEYDATTHSVYWSLAELPSRERGTVELVTLPIEPGTQRLQVSTKARDGLADQLEKHVMVEGIAALMFEVVDLQDPIEVGGETTYEIRVLNQGSKAATNVQVVAIMPSGMRALSGQGETGHNLQGDRVVFEPLQQLNPKAEATFRIGAQGTQPGDQRIRVQITTDEIREPITKEESTRVYADQ